MGDVFTHNTPQITLAQNEHVVQAFAPQTTQKPFAKRVRTRRFHRGPQNLDIRPIGHMLKLPAIFLVVIPNEITRSLTKRRCFAQLLGNPGVCRVTCHVDMDYPP